MIDYLNIPAQALIEMPISKKLFAEKTTLSSVEKRILREDIVRILMKGLLQTRTIGVAPYIDDEFSYDQIIFTVVDIKNPVKVSAIAGMVQKAFPAPMFLILNYQENFCINWCVKRINQADKSKRVIEEQHMTRFFRLDSDDTIVIEWLSSLTVSKIDCNTLKDLFDQLSDKLMMLKIADEAGCFFTPKFNDMEYYHSIIELLNINRSEQQDLKKQIKEESQFNRIVKLNSNLRELQDKENDLIDQLRVKSISLDI